MDNSIITKFEELSNIYTRKFDAEFLNTSTLSVVRSYKPKNLMDLEVWTFICAISNYQMKVSTHLIPMMTALINFMKSLKINYIDLVFDKQLAESVLNTFEWGKKNKGFIHRFFKTPELISINQALLDIINKYGSLGKFIEFLYDMALDEDPEFPLRYILRIFSRKLNKNLPENFVKGIIPIYNKENSTSTMKTLCLYFRWMVRPYPDLNKWQFFSPEHLLVPLDSGIKRVLERAFGLKLNKGLNFKDVLNTTKFLQEINPIDPVKYDFILSRPAVAGYCQKNEIKNSCYYCPLFDLCTNAQSLPKEISLSPLTSKHESELFQRFLRLNIDKFEHIQTEVPLGNRRADAVLHIKNNGIWVVEVEDELNYNAVGQALTYKKLYEEKFNTSAEPVIICEKVHEDIERSCTLDAGIRVITV